MNIFTRPNPLPAGQWCYVKHDTRPRGRVGLPETIKPLNDRYIPVSPKMFMYLQDLLQLASPGMSTVEFYRNWRSLTTRGRAFSNKHGSEDGSFSVENLITGGATVQLVTGKPIFSRVQWWAECRAICVHDPMPAVPENIGLIDWTVHFHPTVITTFKIDSVYRVDPFAQFGGHSVWPMFSWTDSNYYPWSRMIPYNGPQVLSPYIP
jgi:hypothetical protein